MQRAAAATGRRRPTGSVTSAGSGRGCRSGSTAGKRSSIGRSPATASGGSARRSSASSTPTSSRGTRRDDLLEAWSESHNIVVQMTVAMGIVGLVLLVVVRRRSRFAMRRGPLLWAAGAHHDHLAPAAGPPRDVPARGAAARSEPADASGTRRVEGPTPMRPLAIVARVCSCRSLLVGLGGRCRSPDSRGDVEPEPCRIDASASAGRRGIRCVANEAATMIFDPDGTDPRARRAGAGLELEGDRTRSRTSRTGGCASVSVRWLLADDDVARVVVRACARSAAVPPDLAPDAARASRPSRATTTCLRLVNGRLEELGFPSQRRAGRPTGRDRCDRRSAAVCDP